MKTIKLSFLLSALLLSACSEKIVQRPSSELSFKGERLLYKQKPFTGIVEEIYEAAETKRRSHYKNGLRDGLEEEFLNSGVRVSERHFEKGRKVGVHLGWFADGKRRFHHEFSKGEL